MITKLTKVLAVAFIGVILTVPVMGQACAKNFVPILQKIVINGKVLFEDGKSKGKTIEIDSAKPAEIQYVFKNTGTKATTAAGRVFVHFVYNKKNMMGADFWPKTPTVKWNKDFVFIQTNKVNFKRAKGKTITMKLGIYFPKANGVRLTFKGVAGDKRFTVGKIDVK